jgi:hypothetical protein
MKRWDLFAEVTGWVKVGTVEAETSMEARSAARVARESWEWPNKGTRRYVEAEDIYDGVDWTMEVAAREAVGLHNLSEPDS